MKWAINSFRFLQSILLIFLLISSVQGNTEIIRFVLASPSSLSNSNSPYILYDGNSISNRIRLDRQNRPGHIIRKVLPAPNGITNLEWYRIEGTLGQMYEVRVCWPASQPTKFDLTYDEASHSIGVEYSIDYYSSIRELMKQPNPVDFDIILNRVVWFNTIPSDIAETIGLAMVGVVAGYYISKIPYNRGLF